MTQTVFNCGYKEDCAYYKKLNETLKELNDMTVEKEKIINAFNDAWNKKIASENSYGKLASKEMFENKEEIIIDGVDVSGCVQLVEEPNYPCGLGGECEGWENCYYKQLKRLEHGNASLYEEKNCLHKIIDRLLENAGYSKDIASAEDFENVYEDMQYKNNKLEQYKQTLQEIKRILIFHKQELEECLHNNIDGKILDLITKAEQE